MSDGIRRRDVLTGAALALVSGAAARAGVIKGALPWRPDEASPPPEVEPGPWQFFTPEERPTIEALADRIIPPDRFDAASGLMAEEVKDSSSGTSDQDLSLTGPRGPHAPCARHPKGSRL